MHEGKKPKNVIKFIFFICGKKDFQDTFIPPGPAGGGVVAAQALDVRNGSIKGKSRTSPAAVAKSNRWAAVCKGMG